MNKLSLAGLIAGLLLLGALFFGVGFLAAVATYGTSKIETHTSWAAANSADTGKPSAITALAGSVAESFIKDKTADLEAKFGGGALNSLVNKVPTPLRPFAVHAQNKAALAAQQNIGLTSSRLQGALAPRRFGAAQQSPAPQVTLPSQTQQQIRSAFAPRYQAGNPPPQQPLHPNQTSNPFATAQQQQYAPPPQPQYAPPPLQYAPMPQQTYPQPAMPNADPNVVRY